MAQLQETFLFQPTSVSGCQLWLDGADPAGTGVVPATGASITNWVDKSGNSRNASSVTGTPLYSRNSTLSKNGVYFNGSSYLTGSFSYTSNTLSWFVVGTMDSDGDAYGRLLSFGTSAQYDFDSTLRLNALARFNLTNEIGTYRNGYIGSNMFISYSSPFIYSSVLDGVSNAPFLNGTAGSGAATSGAFGFTNFGISVSFGINIERNKGFIFEVVVYSTPVSQVQRQQVEGYLAWKWGLQGNLPSNHPFKTYRPYGSSPFPTSIPPAPLRTQGTQPFVPTQISGCQLWLDAADPSSLVLSGSNVTQWNDKSGQGYNASNLTGTPAYSANGVVFTGTTTTGQAMGTNLGYAASLSNSSMFVIASYAGTFVNNGAFIETDNRLSNNGSGLDFFVNSSAQQQVNGWNTGQVVAGASGLSLDTKYIHALTFATGASGTAIVYLNGTQSGIRTSYNFTYTAGGFVSLSAWKLGSTFSYFFNGVINEILIYNSIVSTQQRQQIEGYLAWKWGLVSSLPNGHPYKQAPIAPFPFRSTAFQGSLNQWIPTRISGCQLWLDAVDPNATGVSVANATTITTWRDKSGNANNGTSAGSIAATYSSSLRAIVFSGTHGVSSTYFSIPDTSALRLGTPYTIYMSYSATALTPTVGNDRASMILLGKFPEGSGYPGWAYRARTYDPTNVVFTGNYFNSAANQGDTVVTSVNVVDGTQKIIGLYQPGTTTMFTRVNGSPDLTLTMNLPISSTVPLVVGTRNSTSTVSNPMNGSVNEILIFTGTLTPSQCLQIEGYLAWKWGLQGNLPANHPFKRWPPSP